MIVHFKVMIVDMAQRKCSSLQEIPRPAGRKQIELVLLITPYMCPIRLTSHSLQACATQSRATSYNKQHDMFVQHLSSVYGA